MSGGKQEGLLRTTRLRGRVGRVQPFVSLLLHVLVGEAEQSLSIMPTGMVHPKNGKVTVRD